MAKIINFKKFYKGNQDKIFKEVNTMVRDFPAEKVKVISSVSKDSDSLHGLGYGKTFTVKNAVKNKEYFIRFGCGCSFQPINPSTEFADYLKKFSFSVSNKEIQQINTEKADAVSSDSYLLDKDVFLQSIDDGIFTEEDNVIITPSGITYFKGDNPSKVYDEYSIESISINEADQEFFNLYGVEEDLSVILRRTASSTQSTSDYAESYIRYSVEVNDLQLIEKNYNIEKDLQFVSSSAIDINNVPNTTSSVELLTENYRNFNYEQVINEHKKISNI